MSATNQNSSNRQRLVARKRSQEERAPRLNVPREAATTLGQMRTVLTGQLTGQLVGVKAEVRKLREFAEPPWRKLPCHSGTSCEER